MKKTALIAAAALLVTVGSSMVFAQDSGETRKEMAQRRKVEMEEKYLTENQITQLKELEANYYNGISDLVKETANMRIELNNLQSEDTPDPDPRLVEALEGELWEKTGQLAREKADFVDQAKSINPAFPYAVELF